MVSLNLTGPYSRFDSEKATPRMRYLSLFFFLALTVGGGMLVGMYNMPGEWYAGLNKPFFNPPNSVFGPVWGVLYVMIAIAGWRVWQRAPAGLDMQVWFAQLALNFFWTSAFFSLEAIGLALVVVIAILLLAALFTFRVFSIDRVAALLFVPYVLWVAFAATLNAALFVLN